MFHRNKHQRKPLTATAFQNIAHPNFSDLLSNQLRQDLQKIRLQESLPGDSPCRISSEAITIWVNRRFKALKIKKTLSQERVEEALRRVL